MNLIFHNNSGTQYDVEEIPLDKNYFYTATHQSATQQDGASVSAIEIEAVPTVYYNLNGLQIKTPEKGIVIEKSGNSSRLLFYR